MKIFLCGQRTFGKEVCRALLAAGHEIVGVAPAPPQKRKDKLHGFAAVQGLPLVTDCKSLVSSFIPDVGNARGFYFNVSRILEEYQRKFVDE